MQPNNPTPDLDQRVTLSNGEERIAEVLDQYDIPFFYKQPVIVYDQDQYQVRHPSFTLPSYGGALIDYLPQPCHPDGPILREIYRYNQIPASVLGPQDLMQDGWELNLYHEVLRELEQIRSLYEPQEIAKLLYGRSNQDQSSTGGAESMLD